MAWGAQRDMPGSWAGLTLGVAGMAGCGGPRIQPVPESRLGARPVSRRDRLPEGGNLSARLSFLKQHGCSITQWAAGSNFTRRNRGLCLPTLLTKLPRRGHRWSREVWATQCFRGLIGQDGRLRGRLGSRPLCGCLTQGCCGRTCLQPHSSWWCAEI